ncbi:MAG: bis(5'-nucleosyl)-tetraphosphatase (symmetrical) YqeK [Candidatus Izemoplasma sp.]|nr:bis(5'-nucleosyl)-tetraphosphatase (symmetrical) YqeK [Candidatus Izemoplasma sp.]
MIDTIKQDLQKIYRKAGKTHRLKHVYGVVETALYYAKQFNVDERKITIASLLHDCTKYLSKDEHIDYIKKGFDNSEWIIESFNENLYHAYSAAAYATITYGITDQDILMAIMHHTVGRPNMSDIEAILFVSDYIEPSREYESCKQVREIAKDNFTKAIYTIMDNSIKLFQDGTQNIPELAYLARDYYKEELKQNEEN